MATDSFAVAFPLPSQECSDPCPYQEKRHHSANNKQQEFTQEVWFHQLLSTHEPPPICTLIFPQRARKHDPVTPSIRGVQCCWRIQGEDSRVDHIEPGSNIEIG